MEEKKLHRSIDTFRRVLYWIVFSFFIAGLIYVLLRVILDKEYRETTAYSLMIFESVLGIIAINIPIFVKKKFKWHMPTIFYVLFMFFLLFSIFFGEVALFYYNIKWWDDMLHLSSSMMLAMLGFSLIDILNHGKNHNSLRLSPLFVAIFSVAFSVLIGVIWEFCEFAIDTVFYNIDGIGTNMQKYAIQSTTGKGVFEDLVGRDALMDTMLDLIIDFCGGVFIAVVGYISLKLDKNWLDSFKMSVIKEPDDNTHSKDEAVLEDEIMI